MFEDKTLVCKDCGKEFVWTAGEPVSYTHLDVYKRQQRVQCVARNDGQRAEGDLLLI